MSILRVANVHFEATGASRIDLVGDTVNIVAGGNVVWSANQTYGITKGSTDLSPAFNQANTAYNQANTVFTRANGAYINVQTFSSSGTWTKPSGYAAGSRVLIQAWGGGGSGAKYTSGGAGGGGGGYNDRWMTLSDMGSTETVTIGAGGTGITVAATSGNAGGTTTLGSLISAYGGAGAHATSIYGGGGGGQLSAGTNTLIAAGASVYSVNTTPGSPTRSFYAGSDTFNCEGGGAAGGAAGAAYKHGGGGAAVSGAAGSSVWGGGGGGASATNTAAGTSKYAGAGGAGAAASSGTAGTQPGGAGGGTATGTTSGAGAAGSIIVTVFPG